jgi:ribonuclease I
LSCSTPKVHCMQHPSMMATAKALWYHSNMACGRLSMISASTLPIPSSFPLLQWPFFTAQFYRLAESWSRTYCQADTPRLKLLQ